MKSPIANVSTKMVPIMMPGLASRMLTSHRIYTPVAPPSRAASISDLSIRNMVFRIGTIMKNVSACTKVSNTEKSENSNRSRG